MTAASVPIATNTGPPSARSAAIRSVTFPARDPALSSTFSNLAVSVTSAAVWVVMRPPPSTYPSLPTERYAATPEAPQAKPRRAKMAPRTMRMIRTARLLCPN